MEGQQENKSLEQRANYRISDKQFGQVYELAYRLQEEWREKETDLRKSGEDGVEELVLQPNINLNGDGKIDSSLLYNEKYMRAKGIKDRIYIDRALEKIVGNRDVSNLRVIGRMAYKSAKGVSCFIGNSIFASLAFPTYSREKFDEINEKIEYVDPVFPILAPFLLGTIVSCIGGALFSLGGAIYYLSEGFNNAPSVPLLTSFAITGTNVLSGVYEAFRYTKERMKEERRKKF